MISEIRKTDEKVSIVLLTAYEDFSYAKAAIRLGITEYVIKSEITENSLSELFESFESKYHKSWKAGTLHNRQNVGAIFFCLRK